MKIGLLTFMTVRSHIGIGAAYVKFCEEIARRANKKLELVLINHSNEVRNDLDILIIPGGADVDPGMYSEELSFMVGRTDPQRDFFTKNVLPLYIENNTPIFGICRGHQEIAAHFGMELIQDKIEPLSPYEFGKTIEKVQLMNYYDVHEKTPKNKDGTTNWKIVNGKKVKHVMDINSRHHQCLKECNPSLATVTAHIDGEPKRIEAIEYVHHNIITVQWHPEILFDQYSMDSVAALLKISAKKVVTIGGQ
jgi:gamma-glutamyl-gamma-aminobutyrate hydrolase PuuD